MAGEHNLPFELSGAEMIDGTQIGNEDVGGIRLAFKAAAPAGSEAGYAKGCLWFNSAGSTSSNHLYINIGTITSATWEAFTSS